MENDDILSDDFHQKKIALKSKFKLNLRSTCTCKSKSIP